MPAPTALVRFLACAVGYLLAAGVATAWATAGDDPHGRWLALHLAFVGAVSLMVLGAGQFFATAFLMTSPPGPRMVAAQLAVWNAGTVLVAVGVTWDHTALTDPGAALLLVGLALFALSLRALLRRSLQRRHWAVRWYLASAAFLAVGAVLGALMARGVWIDGGSILGAHVALNAGGWFGTAIVGTLHTFYPSLTRTELRHPRLQAPVFAAWTGGIAVLAAGYATGLGAAVVVGWALLALAAGGLAVNLVASRRAATDLRLPGRLVGAAQPFLVAGVVVGLAAALQDGAQAPLAGEQRGIAAALLLTGWVGLTVSGSLLHLLAVLGRVRAGRPIRAAAPPRDIALSWAAVAAVSAVALAEVPGLEPARAPARAALSMVALVVAALVLEQVMALARGVLAGPPAPSPAGCPRRR